MHKIFCSLLVTVGLLLLPLPTLADTGDPVANSSIIDSDTSTATVTSDITTSSTSGDAMVSDNEAAGDATSGDATATSTVLNVVNPNNNITPTFSTFSCDVKGDNEGNLLIDPASLLPICTTTPAGTATQTEVSTQGPQTSTSLTNILNNILHSATSGNATVSDNKTAGNATSGDATSLANIVNIANTSITSKNAFLGIINIFGNLKGDILVPQSLVDSLATPSASSQHIDTTSIANNVTANVQTGNATVTDNGLAGDANSGDATTSITVLNLTGQQVVAKNSLLVFVNVLGKWLGMIVPAPGNTNTAMLGGSIQGSDTTVTPNTTTSATSITNNITLNSRSGDAIVSDNEIAGNATTGSAKAGANILNITDSNFLLDDWFGALFINVLGSWIGNFDIQAAITQQPSGNTSVEKPKIVQDVKVYQFMEPTNIQAAHSSAVSSPPNIAPEAVAPVQDSTQSGTTESQVLGTYTSPSQDNSKHASNLDLLALAGLVIAFTIIIALVTIGIRHKLLA